MFIFFSVQKYLLNFMFATQMDEIRNNKNIVKT